VTRHEPHEVISGYRPLGALAPETHEPGTRTWRFNAPGGDRASIALLAPDLARIRYLPPGVDAAHSWAVERIEPGDWPDFAVTLDTGENGDLTVTTAALRLRATLDPFRLHWSWPDGQPFAEEDVALGMGVIAPYAPNDAPDVTLPAGAVRCHLRLAAGERILGGGERTAALEKRGARLVYWNIDPDQPYGPETRNMYASFPFWLGLRNGRTYGIFLDTVRRADLDAGATQPEILSFGALGGDLTYYLFAGPTPEAVLGRYADLTGHAPLPPLWALGYGQCRWSYYPETQVREIAAQFRARRIPCDHLWLDIDYMDGYRVFTFSPRRFPEPKRLMDDLSAQGFKVVTIVDPGVKVDPTDPTYADGVARDHFVRRADGTLFTGVVWPGESAFPDFSRPAVRTWWGERHRALLDAGVTAIWDDMNEPALTDRFVPDGATPRGATLISDVVHRPEGADGPPLPHAAFHNAYGMQMARATQEGLLRLRPDQRPFVLSRSGYAGIQRYAALWTGDNSSDWDNLRLASRMCLALGLAGVAFCGFDTGGFWGSANGPLLVRWTQLGAVFPFFRNHTAFESEAHEQEPWTFGQPFETFVREAIELRYRLLPYLYTVYEASAASGAPIARPLIFAFPEDGSLAEVDDQHLLGGDLLCAPVVAERDYARLVTFPRGAWVDWQTGERIVGPVRRRVDSPLDLLPLFAREGAILPLGPLLQFVGEKPQDPITLACYLGPAARATAEGMLYEDDGATLAYTRGTWRRTRFTARRGERGVTFVAEQPAGAYDAQPHEWVIELHLPHSGRLDGQRPHIAEARRADAAIEGHEALARRHETILRLPLGCVAAPFTVEITLGSSKGVSVAGSPRNR
jgi:alpha-glucosidase